MLNILEQIFQIWFSFHKQHKSLVWQLFFCWKQCCIFFSWKLKNRNSKYECVHTFVSITYSAFLFWHISFTLWTFSRELSTNVHRNKEGNKPENSSTLEFNPEHENYSRKTQINVYLRASSRKTLKFLKFNFPLKWVRLCEKQCCSNLRLAALPATFWIPFKAIIIVCLFDLIICLEPL